MNYAMIMAGGSGKRLWPLSRKKHPKQILKLFEGQTLLRRCFLRIQPLFDPNRIFVLTSGEYADMVRENLPELPYENVIPEPAVRDTAGAIGLGATAISTFDPDATMAVVTADQIIKPVDTFRHAMRDALQYVNDNPAELLTFGIQPSLPSTQLGYIKCKDAEKIEGLENPIYRVEQFKEKPNSQLARSYYESGLYFWNSGMFIWKARIILDKLRQLIPEFTEPLENIKKQWNGPNRQKVLRENFTALPKISIDYAVLEKTHDIHCIRLDCQWMDMGSFAALYDFIRADENNNLTVAGVTELLDCSNTIVVTEQQDHLITGIGLDNLIIAHSPNATLVCSREEAHRIKDLLQEIERDDKAKFL